MAARDSEQMDVTHGVTAQVDDNGQQHDPAPRDVRLGWTPPPLAAIALFLPMLYLYVEHQLEERANRPPRVHRPRIHRAPDPAHICVATYRLDAEAVQELCVLLGPQLQTQVQSERCIPVVQKILMCLHYLAKGSFQGDVARLHHTSQSSASRCVATVVDALLQHIQEYIRFPVTREEMDVTRAQFYALAGFPNVLGAVDGTHICISRPPTDDLQYLNRHHQMSLNVMATADAQCYFTSVVAQSPGSFHDARVFRESHLQDIAAMWDDGSGWLLGG